MRWEHLTPLVTAAPTPIKRACRQGLISRRDADQSSTTRLSVAAPSGQNVHPIDWDAEPEMIKTNAVRALDRLGIRYELREYEVDPDDLSAGTVAAKTGIPPEQLFKTLAVQGDRNGIYLAVIPATEELDFKALAHQTGDRKVDMVPLKEVQTATGYIRGGVTALACKKDYPVYIDELAEICEVISVSAGMRGLQILLAPEDYIRAVKAKVVAITKGEANSHWSAAGKQSQT
jgi:Cys-tRNA(Pro)/Cys-tRNA(Cys) deacylase